MKAITIKQPWAWAIVNGYKPVENRSWRVDYRGPLAIHAATSDCEAGWRFVSQNVPCDMKRLRWRLSRGAVIGTVELVDIVPVRERVQCPWSFGPYCWIFENPLLLPEPVFCCGALSIWNWEG